VESIFAVQFARVPGLGQPEQITLREEDAITAFYSAGHLYAEPSRLGPYL
jgi:photosynthetic reaction center H subunit